MKGAKESSPPPKIKSVVQAAKTSTSTPSEISEIMFSYLNWPIHWELSLLIGKVIEYY